jgi:REP element-mobilizing transposase RayT
VTYYRRNLPHWHPDGAVIFFTWKLHGCYHSSREKERYANPGQAFLAMDRVLDKADCGPTWLKQPRIAQCVKDALEFGERQLKLYSLIAYVIMPNHVHVVLSPKTSLPRITKSIKGFTARKANAILGRTSEPFWQDESYDHWARNESELQKIIGYVERNPVSSGLVERIEEWPWSSAYTGKNACATVTGVGAGCCR